MIIGVLQTSKICKFVSDVCGSGWYLFLVFWKLWLHWQGCFQTKSDAVDGMGTQAATVVVIFWNFFIFSQLFLSPQLKQGDY